MTDVQVVQGDSRPGIVGTLKHKNGDPVDLTNAAQIRFQMRKPDDRKYQVNNLASIDADRTSGKVRYDWGPNDLTQPGLYQAQWEIRWDDDAEQTTTPPNLIEVRRQ